MGNLSFSFTDDVLPQIGDLYKINPKESINIFVLCKLTAEIYSIKLPSSIVNKDHINISIFSPLAPKCKLPIVKNRIAELFICTYDLAKIHYQDFFEKNKNSTITDFYKELHVDPNFIFSDEDANEILNFVNNYINKGVKTIIINCEAGVSRSAGVAQALQEIFNNDKEKFLNSRFYLPNDYIYEKIMIANKKKF